MIHSFNIREAEIYGVECSILLYNIRFWIEKNKSNNKHFYDDKYWTYNSAKAFKDLFPYFSEHQISRFLKKLEEENAIIVGNYNKAGYDKTKWYSVNDTLISQKCKINASLISQNCKMEFANLQDGVRKIARPIPDINTDINNSIEFDFNNYLSWFNNATGKNLRMINDKTKKNILKLLKLGYTKADLVNAVKNCLNDPYHIDNPHYLTPEFISRHDKFEKYLNYTTKNKLNKPKFSTGGV